MAGSALANILVSEWTNRCMGLASASASMQGGRDTMEDGVVAWTRDIAPCLPRASTSEPSAIGAHAMSGESVYEAIAVCDGHGGAEAARDALAYLPPAIDARRYGLTARCLADAVTEMRCAALGYQGTTLSMVIAQPIKDSRVASVTQTDVGAEASPTPSPSESPSESSSSSTPDPPAPPPALSLSSHPSPSDFVDVVPPADAARVHGGVYLWIATLGDSPVLVLYDDVIVFATGEHDPRSPSESQRIVSAGGTVTNGRVNGRINMSRSLGNYSDKARSDLYPHLQAMSCRADVARVYAPPGSTVVTASDGLYERLSYRHVADFVAQMRSAPSRSWSAADIALGLVEYARASGSADNVTVAVTLVGASRQNVCTRVESHQETGSQTSLKRQLAFEAVKSWAKRAAADRATPGDATSRVERYGERPTCDEMLWKARFHIMTALLQLRQQCRRFATTAPASLTPTLTSSFAPPFCSTSTSSSDSSLSLPSSNAPLYSPASWAVLDRDHVPAFRSRPVEFTWTDVADVASDRAKERRLQYTAGVRPGRTTSPAPLDAGVHVRCHHPPAQTAREALPDARWSAVGVDTHALGARGAAWCASLDHLGVKLDARLLRYMHSVCADRHSPETLQQQACDARAADRCVAIHCLRPSPLTATYAEVCSSLSSIPSNVSPLASSLSSESSLALPLSSLSSLSIAPQTSPAPRSSSPSATSLSDLMRDIPTSFGQMLADSALVSDVDVVTSSLVPSTDTKTTMVPRATASWWCQVPDDTKESRVWSTPQIASPVTRAAYGACTTTLLLADRPAGCVSDLVDGMSRIRVATAGVCLYVTVVCPQLSRHQQSWRDAYALFKAALESVGERSVHTEDKPPLPTLSDTNVDERAAWRRAATYAELIREFWKRLDVNVASHTHVGVLCVASPHKESPSSSSSSSSSSSFSRLSGPDPGFVVCVSTRDISLDVLTHSDPDGVSLTHRVDATRPSFVWLASGDDPRSSSLLALKAVDMPHPADAIIVMASSVSLYFVTFQLPTRAPFSEGAGMADAACVGEIMETALDAAVRIRDIESCVWVVSAALGVPGHDNPKQGGDAVSGDGTDGRQTGVKGSGAGRGDGDDNGNGRIESKALADGVASTSSAAPERVYAEPDEDAVEQYVDWINERLARRQTFRALELATFSAACARLRRTFVCGIRAPNDTCVFCSDAECEDEATAWQRWKKCEKGAPTSSSLPPTSRYRTPPTSGLWLTDTAIDQWNVQHMRQLVASLPSAPTDTDPRRTIERALHAVRTVQWNAFAALASAAFHLATRAATTRETIAFHDAQLAALGASIDRTGAVNDGVVSVLPFVVPL